MRKTSKEPGGLRGRTEPLGGLLWRALTDRLGRVVTGHLKEHCLSPLPFWLKMTQIIKREGQNTCLSTPDFLLNAVSNPNSKQGLFSRSGLARPPTRGRIHG